MKRLNISKKNINTKMGIQKSTKDDLTIANSQDIGSQPFFSSQHTWKKNWQHIFTQSFLKKTSKKVLFQKLHLKSAAQEQVKLSPIKNWRNSRKKCTVHKCAAAHRLRTTDLANEESIEENNDFFFNTQIFANAHQVVL